MRAPRGVLVEVLEGLRRRDGLTPLVSTVTSTLPVAPGGVTARIRLSFSTSKEAAGVAPNLTDVPTSLWPKPVPSISTTVPPLGTPRLGVTVSAVPGSAGGSVGATSGKPSGSAVPSDAWPAVKPLPQ